MFEFKDGIFFFFFTAIPSISVSSTVLTQLPKDGGPVWFNHPLNDSVMIRHSVRRHVDVTAPNTLSYSFLTSQQKVHTVNTFVRADTLSKKKKILVIYISKCDNENVAVINILPGHWQLFFFSASRDFRRKR